eukprot:1493777-Pyramimonas_sp.AAC.1
MLLCPGLDWSASPSDPALPGQLRAPRAEPALSRGAAVRRAAGPSRGSLGICRRVTSSMLGPRGPDAGGKERRH